MNIPTPDKLATRLRPLQAGLAMIVLLGGIDKYFNLLSYWPRYVPEFLEKLMPLSPQNYMYAVGVFEIAVGLVIILKPKIGGCLAAGMFAIIVGHLLLLPGYYNIIMLDLGLALASFSLSLAWPEKSSEK